MNNTKNNFYINASDAQDLTLEVKKTSPSDVLYEDEANESKRQSYVAMLQELNDNPDVSKEEFTKYYDAYKQYSSWKNGCLPQNWYEYESYIEPYDF